MLAKSGTNMIHVVFFPFKQLDYFYLNVFRPYELNIIVTSFVVLKEVQNPNLYVKKKK